MLAINAIIGAVFEEVVRKTRRTQKRGKNEMMTREVKRAAISEMLDTARQILMAIQVITFCEPECREDALLAEKVRKALNNLK